MIRTVMLLILVVSLAGCGCLYGKPYVWESTGQTVCLDP